MKLLDTLDGWIDEIPPQHSPQRFGNLAFRTWGRRLEEVRLAYLKWQTHVHLTLLAQHAEALLKALVPHNLVPHILPYFLTSFGSFVRMDYGTGHEASFAMFLCCLTLTRFFEVRRPCMLVKMSPSDDDFGSQKKSRNGSWSSSSSCDT